MNRSPSYQSIHSPVTEARKPRCRHIGRQLLVCTFGTAVLVGAFVSAGSAGVSAQGGPAQEEPLVTIPGQNPDMAAYEECFDDHYSAQHGAVDFESTDAAVLSEAYDETREECFEHLPQATKDPDRELEDRMAPWQPYEDCFENELGEIDPNIVGEAVFDEAYAAAGEECIDLLPQEVKDRMAKQILYEECVADEFAEADINPETDDLRTVIKASAAVDEACLLYLPPGIKEQMAEQTAMWQFFGKCIDRETVDIDPKTVSEDAFDEAYAAAERKCLDLLHQEAEDRGVGREPRDDDIEPVKAASDSDM